ncbi:hypothetical protein SAMN04490244_10573 [Tranquillimonas rosea]|uniref:Uncharacterized protein n=1 Tax=Tranquillimonas rosea TaxID=641238 RepID=A0A1H9U7N2_9RHOB|nr:hypothetical protein [Tranquillimonas rosea]SES05157.1 hypothetical protein SAMN04490244_10573 [Tranquillimonas rosea]
MGKVTVLQPLEQVRWDCAVVSAPAGRAEELARGDTMDFLALELARVALAYRDARFDRLRRAAGRVAELSSDARLDRMALVARTVVALAGGRDEIALAANVARLDRLGDATLCVIWSVREPLC